MTGQFGNRMLLWTGSPRMLQWSAAALWQESAASVVRLEGERRHFVFQFYVRRSGALSTDRFVWFWSGIPSLW